MTYKMQIRARQHVKSVTSGLTPDEMRLEVKPRKMVQLVISLPEVFGLISFSSSLEKETYEDLLLVACE